MCVQCCTGVTGSGMFGLLLTSLLWVAGFRESHIQGISAESQIYHCQRILRSKVYFLKKLYSKEKKKGEGIVFVFSRKRCYLCNILATLFKADEENNQGVELDILLWEKKAQCHLEWKCIFMANMAIFKNLLWNLMFLIHTASTEHKIFEEI